MELSRGHSFVNNGSRLFLQLALTSVFLFFFGLPAVKGGDGREDDQGVFTRPNGQHPVAWLSLNVNCWVGGNVDAQQPKQDTKVSWHRMKKIYMMDIEF